MFFRNGGFYQNGGGVEITENDWSFLLKEQLLGKKIVADKNANPIAVPQTYAQDANGDWVYNAELDLQQVNQIKPILLRDLDLFYKKKKEGAFAIDFSSVILPLNGIGVTDYLFPTSQPSHNVTITPKPATCQNQKIVGYATNTIQYPTHDRCVFWIQDSLDIQSLGSNGIIFANSWVVSNPSNDIFDYVHYQNLGINGVQYNATQIRTKQPDGYPIVLDKHSLKMWEKIYIEIAQKKEQIHGRYLLLKTQIQNCTTTENLELIKQNMYTGWVEVFSQTETPSGLTVID